MAPILVDTVKKDLMVKLSQEEQRQAGISLAHLLEDLTKEEMAQKDVKEQLKARLSAIESQINSQRIKVTRGEELRSVDVILEFFPETVKVRETRKDTMEIINTRDPYTNERQLVLPIAEHQQETEQAAAIAASVGSQKPEGTSDEEWEKLLKEREAAGQLDKMTCRCGVEINYKPGSPLVTCDMCGKVYELVNGEYRLKDGKPPRSRRSTKAK